MDGHIEHLRFIQGVINRMAQISFIIKGWTLTLSIAVLGFASGPSEDWIGFVGTIPVLMFCFLDAYYLWQERLFRKLYQRVSIHDDEIPSFSMDTTPVKSDEYSWLNTLKRPVIVYPYLTVLLMMIIFSSLMILTSSPPMIQTP